jgi:hypothetical protein
MGWTMSFAFLKLERSLFGQTAVFSVAGLCVSLVLVLAYGLQIEAAWS